MFNMEEERMEEERMEEERMEEEMEDSDADAIPRVLRSRPRPTNWSWLNKASARLPITHSSSRFSSISYFLP